MAFLLPAILPALQALGLGALTGAGAIAVKKVVGDAMPDDQAAGLLALSMQNPDSPMLSSSLSPAQSQGLRGLITDMGATPNLFFNKEVLTNPSGSGFLANPAVSSPNSAAIANQHSQTLSDAAALQQLPSVQRSTEQRFQLQQIPGSGAPLNLQVQSPNGPQNFGALSSNEANANNALSSTKRNPLLSGLQGPYQASSSVIQPQWQGLPGMSQNPQLTPTTPTTALSIHPTTQLMQANQPTFKLEDNQGVLTMRAPTLGTQNPIAQGVMGTGAGSGFASTAKNVGNELLGAVRGAASEAASQAVQQVGGTATSVIKQGLSKAGGFLGNLISSGLTSVAKKVIGDAPPVGFENFSGQKGGFIPPISMQEVYGTPVGFGSLGGRVPTLEGLVSHVNATKVVGDAPPDSQEEVMTADQQAAAVSNLQNSVTFNMMSRLILNEQVLVTSSSLPRGMNEGQLNNFYARDLESLVGTYRQSEVQTTFGLKGMTLQYTSYPTAKYIKETDKYEVGVDSYHCFWCTGVALETSRVAPPCTANTTLNQLAPLLAGAALGEYSSQLRVKTFSTDLDLMVRASAIAMNNIQSQQGYSFCLPLVKAMGYLLQQVQLFGSEVNDLYGDVYFRQSELSYHKIARRFPLETLTGDQIWNGEAWKTASFAVISESDFIKAAVGIVQINNWNIFAPQFWGLECAIVFIPGNDKSNQQMNAVRMTAQAAYPMNIMQMKGNWHFFNRQDQFTKIPTEIGSVKKAGLTRIPGPVGSFLFVIMGAREASSAGVVLGDGSGEPNHSIHLNAIDHPPTNPYTVEEDGEVDVGYAAAFANSSGAILSWITYIKEWESIFGNASDRSSAMRFWADHSVLFGNYFLATNGLDVGSAMTMSFLSWADPTRTNIGTPEAPVWKPSAMETVTDIPKEWTTSGRWAEGTTFLVAMHSLKTATYLPVATVDTPLESGGRWKWDTNSPDFSRLPFEDPMMNYLVYKKWITPNEEYPEVTLDDPARFGHTITVMANLMAGLSDLTSQQRDFMYTELIFSPLVLSAVPMAMMRAKNVLWPALEEILTNGIQFPQYWNNRDCNMHCYQSHTFWDAGARLVVPQVVVDGSVIVGNARIPVSIMGQWFSPLYPQYIQLRLNLPVMKPQRNYITVGNVKRAMFQAEYSEEGTGLMGKLLSPISWLMWRLTLGVIVGPPPVNNGWLVQATNNQGVFEYYVHMEQPDASRNQVLVREYSAGNVTIPPTSFISLSLGEFILKRALTTALQPFNVLMQGPLDAFIGVGSGSTAYQMFVQTNTPQAIFVSDTWATIPDWLFSPTGLQSGRDTI